MKERIMALDVGTKTIGVALSDPLGSFAQPLETLSRKGVKKDVNRLMETMAKYQVGEVVVGLPFELDGSEERSARLARQIGEEITARRDRAVHYVDERFSSVEAERRLIEMNVSRAKRKTLIDQLAAMIILERYLADCQPI
jgi:putative Holliday junction resolvase